MSAIVITAIVVIGLALLGLLLAIRVVQQYEMGVHFRLGTVIGVRSPGLRPIVPVIDVLRPAPGVIAYRHDANPVAGDHHPR